MIDQKLRYTGTRSLRPRAIDGVAVALDGEAWISGPGVIRLDFGVVCAGWIQFASPDLGDPGSLEIGIAAHGDGAGKQLRPVRHGEVYRMEPTSELYEGVRFVWIRISEVRAQWRLRDVRLICQVKPTNYRGSFACSDPQLELPSGTDLDLNGYTCRIRVARA